MGLGRGGSGQSMLFSSNLEEVGVAEGGAETEDEVALRMLGYGLHDGAIDDDEVFGRRFDVAAVARVARVEEERGALEADPVAAPAALPRQLHLVLLAQQPFLHTEKPGSRAHIQTRKYIIIADLMAR